jgi:hypothetical protein
MNKERITVSKKKRERYESVKGGVSDDGTPKSRSIRPCTIGVLREVLIKII